LSILVTGGAGFIGSHLMDRLIQQEEQIVCLDNFNDYYNTDIKRENIQQARENDCVDVVEGDIRDRDLCEQLFQAHDFDSVVHLAAMAGVRPSIEQPQLYEEVNCGGTLNLLECAKEAEVDNFIFGSSSSVYGVKQEAPFREEPLIGQPISPYGATKRSCEIYCHTYHHLYDIPIVCLRFFTVYGPRQRPDLAIYKFTDLIERGQPIPVFGDGSSMRDYTYCDDIVDGIMAALERDLDFEIINLGGGSPVTLSELISLLEDALGKKAEINRLPDQPGDMPVTSADISRARELLDYDPDYPVEKGLQHFVRWYRASRK
jgi:UDP-glucuronate 4-epimerase